MFTEQRFQAPGIRTVLGIYAALVGLAGMIVAGLGPVWLGMHQPGFGSARATLVRFIGAVLVAAGCWAATLAKIDDPTLRRRGLLWFAAAHFFILLVLNSQRPAISGRVGPAIELALSMGFLVILLILAYGERLFMEPAPGAIEPLRSRYEQQIREAGAQEERNRLARDLHDSIKQQIFAIQTSAAAAQARFDNDAAGAREALEGVRSSAREAMAEMEAMLDQLRASPLESVGLVEALRRQCEALRFRTGADVQVNIGEIPAPEQLPPGAAQSILRIAQEAFANIARHARATEVQVSLCVEGDDCVLKIRDNGAGFNPDARGLAGMGLANMRARAAERGGKFELRSTAGEGTRVLATIPLTKPEDAEAADRLRQACGMAGAIILAVLLSVLAGIRFEGTALFMFFPIVLFVRYGYAADKAIRMGWVLTGLGVGAALPTFVVHNAFFINAMRGLAAGLLISASVQFFSRSRS